MIDYIKNYPFRYYLQNAFRSYRPGSFVFRLCSNEKADGLSAIAGAITFLPDLHEQTLALPLAPTSEETDTNAFEREERFHFLCDLPEVEVRMLSVESLNIRTPRELFEIPIKTLLPTVEKCHEYVWEFLAPDFSVITEVLPTSVLLVGLPMNVCDQLEQWSLAMGGSAVDIEPWALSLLRWCAPRTKGFLLLPGEEQSFLAIFRDGNLLLLERLPAFKHLPKTPDKLVDRIIELGTGLGLELDEIALEIYQGEAPTLKVKEFAATLGFPATTLEASEAEKTAIEAQGSRVSTNACVMAECVQRESWLFISAKHQDATLYRTHPLYRGTFSILAFAFVMQVAVLGLVAFQKSAYGDLSAISKRAVADAAKIEADEAKLAPLIHRIRSVAEWSSFLREKEPISRVLRQIEHSVPPEVCLTMVAITNNASAPTAPDRLSLKIRGWTKEKVNLETAFLEKLRTALPAFKVLDKTKEEDGPAGSPSSFNVEITQP